MKNVHLNNLLQSLYFQFLRSYPSSTIRFLQTPTKILDHSSLTIFSDSTRFCVFIVQIFFLTTHQFQLDWDPGFSLANPKRLFYYLSVIFNRFGCMLRVVIMLKHHIESFGRLFQILSYNFVYWSCFIIPSTLTRLSVPFEEKQPQNIRLPPSCFTVEVVFFDSKSSPFFPDKRNDSMTEKFKLCFIWP